MAGYTRQSLATIINGANITAPPLNAEFNQVSAAFNASSGHSHDGTSGNSPKINLTTSVAGYLPAEHGGIGGKNKLDATTTPTVTDDNNDGYAPGSLWENTTTGRIYICVGNSTGAAVWRELVQVNSGTAILPAATDTVDLGDNSNRFQDLFLSGGISASGNVAAGGTLNITGATALGSTLGVTGDTTLVNLSATGTTTITSIDLNSGAIDSTTIGTTTPAAGTFTTLNANTSLVAATADINGGSVDGATIGASTPSTGSFTTLGASGTSTLATVDINGGNIDGTAIGASVQSTGAFTTVSSSGQATLATVDINGGSIDGTAIGGNSTSSGAFTTLSASGGITGDIVGNVTGNSSGTHTGAVVGNVTGNLTGNVTSSGSSSFNNVTIDGTLNMNAGTSATIQNLTAPTNDLDAATKKYVDDEISTLIGDAGAGLNTLGELADALNDDDDFSTTVTNSIATKLPKAGGTMTGAIAMSTNKITGVGDPTSAQDVATKVYTDTQRDTRVAKTGDTMSGALAMGSNKITGLGTPTAGTDATTKTYVDGILGSATVAATSASNAATSESNAATSATNASNSATAAASSATSAAASLDSFDDRYLGAKSSAPTVDNDGDALIVGALYFDSTAGAMKVYSANGWTNAGSSVNGTTNRYSYTATAGQTVFAATYDAGYVDVFLNGVKQLVGTDVTATSGTSVVFATGTTVNDIVEIVGYGTFVLADHLTQTQSDARYVNLSGDTMTGALTTTGLTVDGDANISGAAVNFDLDETDTTDLNTRFRQSAGQLFVQTANDAKSVGANRLNINHTTGDISFYNDSGNVKLFWDASAENLGIGTSSPSKKLSVHTSTAYDGALISNAHASSAARLQLTNDDSKSLQIDMGGSTQTTYGPFGANIAAVVSASAPLNIGTDSANHVAFYTNLAERMFISSTGKVGINNNSPTESLHIKGTNPRIYLEGDTNSYYPSVRVEGVNGGISLGTYYGGNISGKNSLTFLTGDSATDGGSPRLQIRGDNDIEIRNLQSAAGGVDTNALYWKIQNSGNTGQYARLGGIKAETVSAWGGKLKFYTKPANGTPNDTVTERMVIDQAGRVTKPYQPAVYVRKTSGQNITSAGVWTVISYNDVSQQNGSNYSNQTNRFTAPISGWYHISATLNVTSNSNASSFSINAFVNGSSTYIGESDFGTGTRQNLTVSGAKHLSSGDYVEIRFRSQNSTAVLDNSGFMSVYLLG